MGVGLCVHPVLRGQRLVTSPMISGPWASGGVGPLTIRSGSSVSIRRSVSATIWRTCSVRRQQLPGLDEVFGEHNPLWQFGPSDDACRGLIDLWRATDPETGELVWDFADASWDTRFLGDLYQDLSEHAKKTYALLQTPDFVEEFILDRTLGSGDRGVRSDRC